MPKSGSDLNYQRISKIINLVFIFTMIIERYFVYTLIGRSSNFINRIIKKFVRHYVMGQKKFFSAIFFLSLAALISILSFFTTDFYGGAAYPQLDLNKPFISFLNFQIFFKRLRERVKKTKDKPDHILHMSQYDA